MAGFVWQSNYERSSLSKEYVCFTVIVFSVQQMINHVWKEKIMFSLFCQVTKNQNVILDRLKIHSYTSFTPSAWHVWNLMVHKKWKHIDTRVAVHVMDCQVWNNFQKQWPLCWKYVGKVGWFAFWMELQSSLEGGTTSIPGDRMAVMVYTAKLHTAKYGLHALDQYFHLYLATSFQMLCHPFCVF